jgi:hypothetical protein
MKKVILTLSVVGLLTSCSSSVEGEAPKTDSTAVAVDTTLVLPVDSVKPDSTVAASIVTTSNVTTSNVVTDVKKK